MAYSFPAKRPGPCWVCGKWINVGDLIARNRGRRSETFYGHPDCIDAAHAWAKEETGDSFNVTKAATRAMARNKRLLNN